MTPSSATSTLARYTLFPSALHAAVERSATGIGSLLLCLQGECIVHFPRPKPENLFETTPPGGAWARAETRPFCQLLLSAASACRAADKGAEAAGFLRELETLDTTDAQDCRAPLVLALMDQADGLAARQILERHEKDR